MNTQESYKSTFLHCHEMGSIIQNQDKSLKVNEQRAERAALEEEHRRCLIKITELEAKLRKTIV
jgi:uncharacterized protein YfcZ (UPF0381/DUF406 family)